MDFPIQINTVGIVFSILYVRCHMSTFPNQNVLHSLKIVFLVANSEDPDEMLHFQYTSKGYNDMSRDMRFPTMWYVRPAKAQISMWKPPF